MDIDGEKYTLNLNLNITVGQKPGFFKKLWNAIFGTTNFIEVDNSFPRPNVKNGYLGTWIGSNTPQRNNLPFTSDNIPAHEVGHLLGFKDRYSDNAYSVSVPHVGWEKNLMATTFGRVEQRNIDAIGGYISGHGNSGTLRTKRMRF